MMQPLLIQQLPLDWRWGMVFLSYPQKLVNNILVAIIISFAQGFTKSLRGRFDIKTQINHSQ